MSPAFQPTVDRYSVMSSVIDFVGKWFWLLSDCHSVVRHIYRACLLAYGGGGEDEEKEINLDVIA